MILMCFTPSLFRFLSLSLLTQHLSRRMGHTSHPLDLPHRTTSFFSHFYCDARYKILQHCTRSYSHSFMLFYCHSFIHHVDNRSSSVLYIVSQTESISQGHSIICSYCMSVCVSVSPHHYQCKMRMCPCFVSHPCYSLVA